MGADSRTGQAAFADAARPRRQQVRGLPCTLLPPYWSSTVRGVGTPEQVGASDEHGYKY